MRKLPPLKIKVEPTDASNNNKNPIPTFVNKPPVSLLQSSVEVIDLTDEHYLNEFKNFLNTLPQRRVDSDVRKNSTKAKSRTVRRIQCLPVDYLEHITFQQDSFIFELLNLSFRNVMLYGRLTAETVQDDIKIYRLDDGTGKVDVFFRSGSKKFSDNLTKLEYCNNLLRRKRTPLNEESVPDSAVLRKQLRLLILIAKTKCARQLNPPKLGTQCFVVGNPFMGREDKVCVFAHVMFSDDVKGSCRIAWQNHLLSIYEPIITAGMAAKSDSSMNDLVNAMDALLND